MQTLFSTLRRVCLTIIVVCAAFFSSTTIHAQASEPDSLTWYWHSAFFAELRNDPKAVIASYDRIRNLCETLPIDVREWFKGTSFFGIARAKATLQDKAGARDALSKALSRHFWNFPMIESLSDLNSVCGKQWIDSVCQYWSAVREREMPFWHQQPTLLLKPHQMTANVKYPVLIVLQGGNDCYERLVTRLNVLPDSLGIIALFPAGVHRISEVTNSWDEDTAAAEMKIGTLIQELSKDPTVDINNVTLLGYSQGSQIAYNYGISHPDQIHNIIAFSGFAPTMVKDAELKKAAADHLRIIAISGSSDSHDFLRTSLELQKEALQNGLTFDLRIEPDLPHGLPMDAIGYISNLLRQLSAVSAQKQINPQIPPTGTYSNGHYRGQDSTGR